MKKIINLFLFVLASIVSLDVFGQTDAGQVMAMSTAFKLALQNSRQLKISRTTTELAAQRIEIARLGRLPNITSSLAYGYISNSDIWSPSFSKHQKGPIPHQFTQLSLLASETVFKGGEVKNSIRKAGLEAQVAVLAGEKNEEDIKFLVAASYLDIYRLMNQRKVLENNAALAKERLKNIVSLQRQGLVTNNDVLRTQLTVSDFELAARKTTENINIINKQLNFVLGLDSTERLVPDTTLLLLQDEPLNVNSLLHKAFEKNPELNIANKEIEIVGTSLRSAYAEKSPELSLFAGDNFQRPYTNSIPAQDVFFNIYQAGISLKYNIGSLYQAGRKIKAGRMQVRLAEEKQQLQQQQVEIGVNTAFIKLREAKDELDTYRNDLGAAEENYRIVEKKYYNQLSLLTELLDASNTKVEAELKVSNAEISVVYAWYELQKAIGVL